MGKLTALRDERRKAETGVETLKARIRLLREVTDKQEKAAARAASEAAKRAAVQGDAEWLKDTLESEYMRREMGGVEKRMLASEQRDNSHATLTQTRQLVSELRLEGARKVRETSTYKLDAAHDAAAADLARRKAMADHGRRHRQWYQEASKHAAEEYKSRVHELRAMAMAEEETRRFLVAEGAEKFLDALAFEEQRLKGIKLGAAAAISMSEARRADEPQGPFW
jgi:hypothetical protein